MKSESVIVIGAGVGGLTAAIHLARRGLNVTIVEKNSHPGGRCDRLSRDGHHFDTGPTLFVMPLLYEAEFHALGASLHEQLELLPVDPTYHLVFDDGLTDAPVIVVSADTKKENVVKGLNIGFDDYVTKPFFPPELVARVNVVLRRIGHSKPVTARVFSAIGLVIDYETHDVLVHDKAIQLSPREFGILAALAKKAPRMVRYEEIASDIWGEDNLKIRNRIKYLIYLIRQKMERDPNNPELILNREGLGYQLHTGEQ